MSSVTITAASRRGVAGPPTRDVIKGGVVRDDESQRVGLAIIRGTGLFGFAALAVLVLPAVWPELLGAK